MPSRLPLDRRAIEAFCRHHRVRKLALYGSVLTDEFRPSSDVDVLVEFEEGASVTFFDLSDMEDELSKLLGGRRVDIKTPQDLSRHIREAVVAGAEVQFAQA